MTKTVFVALFYTIHCMHIPTVSDKR